MNRQTKKSLFQQISKLTFLCSIISMATIANANKAEDYRVKWHSISNSHNKLEADLSGRDISELDLRNLGRNTRLEVLNLSGAKFNENDLKYLPDLKRLRKLNLSRTKLDGSGLKYLQVLSQLEDLDLSDNNISARYLSDLRDLTDLRRLYLFGNSRIRCSDLPRELGRLNGLKVYLRNSRDVSCESGRDKRRESNRGRYRDWNNGNRGEYNVRELNLANKTVSLKDLSELENYTELRKLNLSNTKMSEVFLGYVGEL